MAKVQIRFIGPLPGRCDGRSYLLSTEDPNTGWMHLVPVNTPSETCIRTYLRFQHLTTYPKPEKWYLMGETVSWWKETRLFEIPLIKAPLSYRHQKVNNFLDLVIARSAQKANERIDGHEWGNLLPRLLHQLRFGRRQGQLLSAAEGHYGWRIAPSDGINLKGAIHGDLSQEEIAASYMAA